MIISAAKKKGQYSAQRTKRKSRTAQGYAVTRSYTQANETVRKHRYTDTSTLTLRMRGDLDRDDRQIRNAEVLRSVDLETGIHDSIFLAWKH